MSEPLRSKREIKRFGQCGEDGKTAPGKSCCRLVQSVDFFGSETPKK